MLIFLLSSFVSLNAQEKTSPALQGKYFGQTTPGDKATIFAKDIISTSLYEHSAPAFSPDGRTVLWTALETGKPARMMEMTMIGDTWTKPFSPSFADTAHDDFYPFFSVQGNQLIFSSRRPLPSGIPVGDSRLWIVEHKDDTWGKPIPMDTTVSKGVEYAHSVSRLGNLFFSARELVNGKPKWKIYYSHFEKGKYMTPVPLDSSINNGSYVDGPYVSPDEQFLVFESDRDGGLGSMDLYISFKRKDGQWGAPKNMGSKVNSELAERFAGLSPDGKYFFFGSNRYTPLPDIFWIEARVIEDLKQ
jgi:hypothetical protein